MVEYKHALLRTLAVLSVPCTSDCQQQSVGRPKRPGQDTATLLVGVRAYMVKKKKKRGCRYGRHDLPENYSTCMGRKRREASSCRVLAGLPA